MGCNTSTAAKKSEAPPAARERRFSSDDAPAVLLLKFGADLGNVYRVMELKSEADREAAFLFRHIVLKEVLGMKREPDEHEKDAVCLAVFREDNSDETTQVSVDNMLGCARMFKSLAPSRDHYSYTLPEHIREDEVFYIDEVILRPSLQNSPEGRLVMDCIKQAGDKHEVMDGKKYVLFAHSIATDKESLPPGRQELTSTLIGTDFLYKFLNRLCIVETEVNITTPSARRPSVLLPAGRRQSIVEMPETRVV